MTSCRGSMSHRRIRSPFRVRSGSIRWDQEPWFSESMVIPQNPAKIQKSIIFVVCPMIFWEILANSRSRDREESIPIDLDPFHPILTHFISFKKKSMSIFFSFPKITRIHCLPGRLRPFVKDRSRLALFETGLNSFFH